jgi:hypothetical protein
MFKAFLAAVAVCVLVGTVYADCCASGGAEPSAATVSPSAPVAQAPQAQPNRSFSYQPGTANGYQFQAAPRNQIPVRDFRSATAKATWQY